MKGTGEAPFFYRVEHRSTTGRTVLERTASYGAAILLVNVWSERLRAEGANGSIVVVEEAFETAVARHPLQSASRGFDGGHRAMRQSSKSTKT